MSGLQFSQAQFAAAIARGVSQFVVLGSRASFSEALESCQEPGLRVFSVAEDPPVPLPRLPQPTAFVPTEFESETLASALAKSDFDDKKASLFVWLGGATYRTFESVMGSLTFIASLPPGSGVLFDYAVERTTLASFAHTALDALASRISFAGGNLKYLIHPQAVMALLRGLGFLQIVDVPQEESLHSGHLVSAVL